MDGTYMPDLRQLQRDQIGVAQAAWYRGRKDALQVLEEMIDGDSSNDTWITDAIRMIENLPLPDALK
jgi:hypothetical protein